MVTDSNDDVGAGLRLVQLHSAVIAVLFACCLFGANIIVISDRLLVGLCMDGWKPCNA